MKKGLILIISALMISVLAGCSATEVVDELVEDAAGINSVSEPAAAIPVDSRQADPSIPQPEFETIISGSMNMAVGSSIEINGSAKSPDGGTITYQWYRNNVNSNGGGMAIPGATGASYTAKAEEPGSTFYYVVAANNHDNKCNMITSRTYEVVAYKDGEWKKDEFGTKYVNQDGTFPSELWLMIDGSTYHFDSAGYITTGWLASGSNYYYFDENGKLLANGKTPDGFETDENGRLIGNGVPQLYPTTAEIAAQAKAAADAQGEAAALEVERQKAEAARNAAGAAAATPEPTPAPAEETVTAPAEEPAPEAQPEEEAQIVEEPVDEGGAGYAEEEYYEEENYTEYEEGGE